MSFFEEIIDSINRSQGTEVFLTFDQLYVHFPNGRPDHFRPINPVDLDKLDSESRKARLEPFSKAPCEGGIWFRRSR